MVSNIIILFIRFYQRGFSPFYRPCCLFSPSCSEYAKQCLEKHGFILSVFPIINRLCSCHPFSSRFKKGFWDPVK